VLTILKEHTRTRQIARCGSWFRSKRDAGHKRAGKIFFEDFAKTRRGSRAQRINDRCKRYARIRLEIGIEIELEFNQSEERKSISSLVNFALIGQNPIQFQSQSLIRVLRARLNASPRRAPPTKEDAVRTDRALSRERQSLHGRVIDRGNDFYDKTESKSRHWDLIRTSLNSVKAEDR